jgi:hypothetical protein
MFMETDGVGGDDGDGGGGNLKGRSDMCARGPVGGFPPSLEMLVMGVVPRKKEYSHRFNNCGNVGLYL